MNALRSFFGRQADVALVALVVGVLMVLFVPIPRALLDFLILANFAGALLLLLLTFYMERPVQFSTFPSLLLLATLFRLSLNVAATRLILAEADAGRVIAAIGSYVVGGNSVVGFVVFLVLVVVQYVVVTNGAQRVSEVAARFTLDSMPGQQMSIDADLNMGFIDQAEAQRRRRQLEKEAGFYGAMDGASKFVKGDAIAGITILFINILGGLVIGIVQHRMPWAQALQAYTLLTIGDGIVTQVPALVISVGTGIIVTDQSISWPVGLTGGFQGSMTGRENIKFVCRVYGAEGEAMREKVRYVQEFAEIGDWIDEPIKTYSSGMRSRVAFGLSMAFDFDYYLIDEVMSVGDAQFKRKCAQVFEEKLQRSKVVLVSHSMPDIKKLCDMVLLVRDGRIEVFEDVKEGIKAYSA